MYIDSARLESIARPPGGRRRSTLGAYLHLIDRKHLLIPLVWFFQALRNSPVYVLPLLIAPLFDLVASAPDQVPGRLPWLMAATLGLCVVNVTSSVIQERLRSRQKRNLTAGLRIALMRRLHRLGFAFHDRAQAGALQNKFLLDLGRLEELSNYLAEAVLMKGTTVIVCLVTVGWFNPWLLLVLVAVVPANLFVAGVLWDPIRRQSEAYRHAESGMLAFLTQALSGVRLTRAHAVEEFTEERLGDTASDVAQKGLRVDTTHALFGSASWAVSSLLHSGVLCLGFLMCANDTITLGQLTVYLAYYGVVSDGMGSLVHGMPAVAAANDGITSLAELYAEESEDPDRGKPEVDEIRGTVTLRGVDFRYPGTTRHCLSGLDLEIPAGTSLALVGPSGSGKSTIASLILGFYEPDRGAVLIDGQDLREIDRRSVRRQVGVVSQEVVLFQDSVLGNIAWGDPKPDAERARLAAQRANAHEFIAQLSNGYATMLGDRGVGLSGGQRQRLAIARAIYRDPRLLVLDEATSALDPESERLVQQAIDQVMQGRTTLVIAHRLSTVRHADRIVVLDQGRVVESGTFAELMERQGAFHRLASGQVW